MYHLYSILDVVGKKIPEINQTRKLNIPFPTKAKKQSSKKNHTVKKRYFACVTKNSC